MLIRSQDKTKLMNLDQLTHLQVDKRSGEFSISAEYTKEDGYQYIGDYSSEAKAIKVLDMIQVQYQQHGKIEDGNGNVKSVFIHPLIFQMPRDSEVTT